MRPEFGDFAALEHFAPAAWVNLATLMELDEELVLVGPEILRPACAALRLGMCGFGYLLTLQTGIEPARKTAIERLGDADAEEMACLRGRPEHGDFPPARHRMGRFIGVRLGGELAAMAGENLSFDGYVEIAGLFTRPQDRHRGLAESLVRQVSYEVQARGDTPFAFVTATNMAALRLFDRLGFRRARDVVFSQIRKVAVADSLECLPPR